MRPLQPAVSSKLAPPDDGSSLPQAHADSIDLSDLVLCVSSATDKLESLDHTLGGHKLFAALRRLHSLLIASPSASPYRQSVPSSVPDLLQFYSNVR